MPSTSKAQAHFMQMCAHSRGKATKKCPPTNVAQEFVRADTGKAPKKKGK